MIWPTGEKKYQVERMIEAARKPDLTVAEASKIVDYASAYIYSLPEAVQSETAKMLIAEMNGGFERSVEKILEPIEQVLDDKPQQEPLPPPQQYVSKVKRKRAKA